MIEATAVVGDDNGIEAAPPSEQTEPASARERDRPKPAARPIEPTTWAGDILSTNGSWPEVGRRLGSAIALAAIYGAALGTRDGGLALATHAMGVAVAFAAVLALGIPALFIVLASFDVPLDGLHLAQSAGRGAAAAGLTLAGLAPAAALFVVSTEAQSGAAMVAAVGLGIAAVVGGSHFRRALRDHLVDVPLTRRSVAMLSVAVFAMFAGLLSARICLGTLPILGGAL